MLREFGELRGYFGEIEEYLVGTEIFMGVVFPRWMILCVMVLILFAITVAFFLACTKTGIRVRRRMTANVSEWANRLSNAGSLRSRQRRRDRSNYSRSDYSTTAGTTITATTAASQGYPRRSKRSQYTREDSLADYFEK